MNLFFAVDEQEGDKGEAMGGYDTGHWDIQQAHKNMRLTLIKIEQLSWDLNLMIMLCNWGVINWTNNLQ